MSQFSRFVVILLFLNCLVACSQQDIALRKALSMAGNNRVELVKVIDHYSSNPADSLKLQAAYYLIRNMPYHLSYPVGSHRAYCVAMDSLFLQGLENEELACAANRLHATYKSQLRLKYDISEITAEYLIWNIDYSFEWWRTLSYLQHLDFQDFCEYILPYKRCEGQPMDQWKLEWNDKLRGELDVIQQFSEFQYNARRAAEAVTYYYADSIDMHIKNIDGLHCFDLYAPTTLLKQPYGICWDHAKLGLLNCCSKGIPVAIDFTPNWADRESAHYWNNVLVSRRENSDYEPFENYPGAYHYCDNPLGKVFRLTYAPHPILLEALEAEGAIPSSLSQLFMRDVTDEYSKTVRISIPISKRDITSKYAYLAVFDNNNWIPADVCRRGRKRATFDKVGVGILYIVMTYESGRSTPISEPFIVDTRGNIRYMKLDHSRTQSIRLYRKFPSFAHIYYANRYLKGGAIEASDNAHFKGATPIVELSQRNLLAGEITIPDTLPHRYWRLKATGKQAADFAEIYFYERNTGRRITGVALPVEMPIRNPEHDTPSHICDNDPLTYFRVENTTPPCRAGFDFGKPVAMHKIAYIRRGDGNGICPGDEYELYFWEDNAWRLHERKVADNIYLDFQQVPSGGLYYIKCISRGVQNRTFIYQNGEAVWY